MKKIIYINLLFLILLSSCNTSNFIIEKKPLKEIDYSSFINVSELDASKVLKSAENNYIKGSEDFSISTQIVSNNNGIYKNYTDILYSRSTNELFFQSSDTDGVSNGYCLLKDNKTHIYTLGSYDYSKVRYKIYNKASLNYCGLSRLFNISSYHDIQSFPKSQKIAKNMYGINLDPNKTEYHYAYKNKGDLYLVQEKTNYVTYSGLKCKSASDIVIENNRYKEIKNNFSIVDPIDNTVHDSNSYTYKFNYNILEDNEIFALRKLSEMESTPLRQDDKTNICLINSDTYAIRFDYKNNEVLLPNCLKNEKLSLKYYYDENKEYEINSIKDIPDLASNSSDVYTEITTKDNNPIVIETYSYNKTEFEPTLRILTEGQALDYTLPDNLKDKYFVIDSSIDGNYYNDPSQVTLERNKVYVVRHQLEVKRN